MTASYAQVPYPWRAAVARGADGPARHYAAIVGQAVRYGLPARRRPAAAWTRLARRGLPEGAFAKAVGRLPGRPRPDLDRLLDAVGSEWGDLAARDPALPAERPARLSALSLERRAARTVFVFGEGRAPLLVAKVPTSGEATAEAEAAALLAAEPAGVAPRFLGRPGGAYAQSVVPGTPLAVQPLGPAGAAHLELPAALADAFAGLERLGATTAADAPPAPVGPLLARAGTYPDLAASARRALAAAAERVAGLQRSVLGHRDTSPQNLHCAGDRLTGLLDWELAEPRWLPGLDTWIAAVSYVEHCVGLERWSQDTVLGTFSLAWAHAPFFERAREAAGTAVRATGLSGEEADALALAFFGIRLAHRMERPEAWPTTASTAARMLEIVAAR